MFSLLKIVKFYLVRINFMTLLKPYQRFLVSCRKKIQPFCMGIAIVYFCNLPVLDFLQIKKEHFIHLCVCFQDDI